ncbi:MAG: glycosyltransferase 87 family protein [Desulfuromonas sp.]
MKTQHKKTRGLRRLRPTQALMSLSATCGNSSIFISISVVVVCIVLAYLFLASLNSFLLQLPAFLVLCAHIVIALSVLVWLADGRVTALPAQLDTKHYVVNGFFIISAALFLRLLFIARMPELSDDIFRYLWDGLQLRMGHNPYSHAPAALIPTQQSLAELQTLINHPDLVTIYPPVAQLIFVLSSGSLVGMKGIFILFDLGNCVFILLLLRLLQHHPAWLCVYALHPLAVLESSASGHVDVVAVFFILAAIYFSLKPVTHESERVFGLATGAALGLAIMTKVFPLIFAPLLFIQLPRRARAAFLLALSVVSVGVCIPFWPELRNGIHTLHLYAQHWEFSGFAFRILRHWTESGQNARILLGGSFCLIFGWQWLRLYAFHAHTNNRCAPPFVGACMYITLAFLLLTPTLHPWYALYLLAFIPLAPSLASFSAGITLSWAVLLSYQVAATRVMSGIWQESTLLSFYVFAAPVSALCITLLLARRRNRRWHT